MRTQTGVAKKIIEGHQMGRLFHPCRRWNSTSKSKTNFFAQTPFSLRDHFEELELKETVAPRVWNHVYTKGVSSFDQIPDSSIGKQAKRILNENFILNFGAICKANKSESDGTAKWLIGYDKHRVETVFIPSDISREDIDFPAKRTAGTICVSSQVGCTVGCPFCFTGTQKIARNLLAEEIIGQVMVALQQLDQFKQDRDVQTIVFMGQGEPFYNYSNVIKAIRVFSDPSGLAFSKKRITVSTSGVVPMIKRFTADEELDTVQLAVSLHAARDSIRDKIVPLNKQWDLKELIGACRDYHQKRRILFEYVMLKGVNDSVEDAKALLELMKGIRAVVNLIPFNYWPGAPFQSSEKSTIMEFHNIILNAGIPAPIRWPRGDDILAACGQLQTVQEKVYNTGAL